MRLTHRGNGPTVHPTAYVDRHAEIWAVQREDVVDGDRPRSGS